MDEQWQNETQRRLEKERLARKILGVDESADILAIKKAFWLLAMKHHPDKRPGDAEAQKRFANMVSAYEFLTKGESKGWDPEPDDAPEEPRIGEYLANEWGYFCWWSESFGFRADDTKGREGRHEPRERPSKSERRN